VTFERMRCSGRYQRMMEFLSATSSRLLAANVILRAWAGSGQGLGDSQAGVATGKSSFRLGDFHLKGLHAHGPIHATPSSPH
jgi:hypothetical protein